MFKLGARVKTRTTQCKGLPGVNDVIMRVNPIVLFCRYFNLLGCFCEYLTSSSLLKHCADIITLLFIALSRVTRTFIKENHSLVPFDPNNHYSATVCTHYTQAFVKTTSYAVRRIASFIQNEALKIRNSRNYLLSLYILGVPLSSSLFCAVPHSTQQLAGQTSLKRGKWASKSLSMGAPKAICMRRIFF